MSRGDPVEFTRQTDGIYHRCENQVRLQDGDGDVIDATNPLAVDATGSGDVPVTLDSEVVDADITGHGDVPVTLDGETVSLAASDGTDIGDVDVHTFDGIVEATPTLDTGAYADGDLMADATEIPNAVESGKAAVLVSLVVEDKDHNAGGFHVVFLRSSFDMGTLNSTPDPTDAEGEEILGIVSVAAADYVDLGAFELATVEGLALAMEPTTGTSLYFAVVSDGNTGTYTASGLVFKFGFLRG